MDPNEFLGTDYLGEVAPISVTDKPALPVGTPFSPSAGPVVASDGAASTGSPAGGTLGGTRPGAPTLSTGSAGAISAIPSIDSGTTPTGGVRSADGESPFPIEALIGAGGKVASLLKSLFDLQGPEGDAAFADLDPAAFSLSGGEGPASTLDPNAFSLTSDDGSALTPENFSLGKFKLNANLPAALREPFAQALSAAGLNPKQFSLGQDAAPVLRPETFSFNDDGGASTLAPDDFSLGVDTTLDTTGGSGGLDMGGALGLAAQLGQLGLNLFNQDRNGVGGALVKAAVNFIGGGGLQAAVGEGSFNPVLAAWTLPQTAANIQEMFDPSPDNNPETLKRRNQRTADADSLAAEILGSFGNGRTLDEALRTNIGGATVGDALASILNYNLGGGWYAGSNPGQPGTAHNWLPDPSLLPMRAFLEQAGYLGSRVENGEIVMREPTRGDVGGVGEMVMSGSPVDAFADWQARQDAGDLSLQSTWHSDPQSPWRRLGFIDEYGQAPATVPLNAYTFGPAGWEHLMRGATEALTGQKPQFPSMFEYAAQQPTGELDTFTRSTDAGIEEYQGNVYPDSPLADTEYRDALRDLMNQGVLPFDAFTNLMQSPQDPLAEQRRVAYESSQIAGGG